ncbi:signal peptidase subunit-domain-containing protein [Lasiosphaeria miniovina]|uniref:Signal peptidase subunit 3 n=2 Tax=Lasiosphaeria TaxID=92901 RepID=A0AA40B5C6_9PEZI|nr:signal peptidase subunit-domain-containing protein [Lasiosphaeria miniovina]KAK0727929.1 signal peptidase subunit-domain-containing protein [Lasiosphaeria miniovina]KAK3374035.1 signal peptidase subunit-domain-containing protein [Lasiosphaeria ovina]
MYSSLVRLQNTFGFFTTVAFVIAAFIAASDFASPRAPSVATLKTTSLQVVRGRPHYYSSKKEEYAIIKFSLDANLSSLFTWNTKQVFVYVTAEWPSSGAEGNATNQAVIWDTIITAPSADHLSNLGPASLKKLRKSAAGKSIDPSRGLISLKNQKPKYQITHPSGKIAETQDVRLRLHYNVQPWVGVLAWNQNVDYGRWKRLKGDLSKKFALPALKTKAATTGAAGTGTKA